MQEARGYCICGLDEAGRGALAGPLVLAAVVLPTKFTFNKADPEMIVRDSKLMSDLQRLKAYRLIKKVSLQVAFEVISAAEINKAGINWANTEGFRRLIAKIDANRFIVDGRWTITGLGEKKRRTRCVIDADETIPAAMAAGIVAKVKRDSIMNELHLQNPWYGWNTNTGHGTARHLEAIWAHGICGEHRLQFVNTALLGHKAKSTRPAVLSETLRRKLGPIPLVTPGHN
jgi:ribonuclease HII